MPLLCIQLDCVVVFGSFFFSCLVCGPLEKKKKKKKKKVVNRLQVKLQDMWLRALVNPRRMREGYGSRSVCVCLSAITLTATYLVNTMQTRRH